MREYVMRVRLNNGSWTEVTIRANGIGTAISMIESQYGSGSYMGILGESYV